MSYLKNISFYLFLSGILNLLSDYLESDFLISFLCSNLIIILLTLLAINTATTGLLAIKMSELMTVHPKLNFKETYREMKLSLKEQIALIIISLFLQVIYTSKVLLFPYKDFLIGTFLMAVLIYAIDILRDTGVSIFNLLDLATDFKNKTDNSE